MQAHYPFEFEREMGCTPEDLRRWLPDASGGREVRWREGGADIALEGGLVSIDWQALEPRRIALISLPRASVRFAARAVADAHWQRFMRCFDLHVQRGGG